MTRRTFAILVCILASLAVGGCQTIAEKRKIDYKSTRTLPPLEIPPDLSSPDTTKGPLTSSPPSTATYSGFVTEQGAQTKSTVGGDVLPDFSNLRIARDGQIRWLEVKMTPEQVWPKARNFILNNGLLIDKENPQTGILETDWAENRAQVGTATQMILAKALGSLYSTGTRDKYRIRLEDSAEPGTTEIYLSHRGMEEVIVETTGSGVGQTKWQSRPPDPGLEAEMLRLLMVSLGAKQEQAQTVLASAAAAPPPAQRATLSREGDAASLILLEDFERAWRRVGLALDRTSFTVQDRDRSKGVYYVRYIDPDTAGKKKGFFGRLFSGKENETKNEYQILVKGEASESRVEVLNKDGTPEQSNTSGRILTLLYDQLK
ncbi:MAG TPA: outer membrane protein assembly factor BamC [Gammaproteobacteria bacterium]